MNQLKNFTKNKIWKLGDPIRFFFFNKVLFFTTINQNLSSKPEEQVEEKILLF